MPRGGLGRLGRALEFGDNTSSYCLDFGGRLAAFRAVGVERQPPKISV